MTYGTATRSKARLNVLRGYAGNEPKSLSFSAQPLADEAILSGMIISLNSDGKWIKGAPAGKVPFIAYHDQSDSTVDSSGLLLGLSCAGDYEVQTAFFLTTASYPDGTALLADATATATATRAGLPGYLAKAVARTTPAAASPFDVVGYASRGGKVNVANINSGVTKDADGAVLVLTWFTRWTPNQYAVGLAAT